MRFTWGLLIVAFACTPARSVEPNRLVTSKPGEMPIILSAPHGGREAIPNAPIRKGEGVDQFVVVRDENTAELAESIAAELAKRLGARPYLVIARFDRKYVDANRGEKSAVESEIALPYFRAYHQSLADFTKEIQKKWKRGLLLDIHGQAKHPGALVRGTNNGQTVELLVQRFGRKALTGSKSLFGTFAGAGYQVIPGVDSDDKEDPRFLGGYIVRTYGSHQGRGIDALQLEFGSDLRQKNVIPKTASAMAEALDVFCRAYLREAVPVRNP